MTEVRHGIVYRCTKRFGHERDPGDWEHEAQAPEYAYKTPDWRAMMLEARTLLEWMATNPTACGEQRCNAARRLMVRVYMADPNATKPEPTARPRPKLVTKG